MLGTYACASPRTKKAAHEWEDVDNHFQYWRMPQTRGAEDESNVSAARVWTTAGWLGGAAMSVLSIACVNTESPGTVAATNAHPHAAAVWAAKCASCHVRVEPGTRPRPTIDAALVRHRVRAKLTDGEWAELADFLAPNDAVAMGSHTDEKLGTSR